MQVHLKIRRFDPDGDHRSHWQEYDVEVDPMDRVLDALNTLKWEQDVTHQIGMQRIMRAEMSKVLYWHRHALKRSHRPGSVRLGGRSARASLNLSLQSRNRIVTL